MSTRDEIINELHTNNELISKIVTIMKKDGITPVLIAYGGTLATNTLNKDKSDIDIFAFHEGEIELWSLDKILSYVVFMFTPFRVSFSSENIDRVVSHFNDNLLTPELKAARWETILHYKTIYEGDNIEEFRNNFRTLTNHQIGTMYLDAGDYAMNDFGASPDKYGVRALRMFLQGYKILSTGIFEQDMQQLTSWAGIEVDWNNLGTNTTNWQPMIDSARNSLVSELSKL